VTGRQKLEAAFCEDGTPEIGAAICYMGIFIRDHWGQLTAHPWWWQSSPGIEKQLAWRRDVYERVGQDWHQLPWFYPRAERDDLVVRERPDGVFLVNERTGWSRRLEPPRVGGAVIRPARLVAGGDKEPLTFEEVDALLPLPESGVEGHADLAAATLDAFGEELFPIGPVSSPMWSCFGLWGFDRWMTLVVDDPELVKHASRRGMERSLVAVRELAAAGCAGVWVEECLTDMISPAAFESLNLPFVKRLVDEIRTLGMKSIYYFCGDPSGKWDLILSAGADAVSFEESKKGFSIDIEQVVERVRGRCVVLGNLDAIGLLPNCSEAALEAEVARQIAAGRRNGSRFIMSLGSPVTPGTSVEKVRLYCDLVHELGSR